jgi:antitoxin HicB
VRNKHCGSSFESFLKEEGNYEAATSVAIERVVAWRLTEARKAEKISRTKKGRRLKSNRT